VSGTISIDATGAAVGISLSATNACKWPVTGFVPAAAAGVTSETYGPEVTAWVTMAGGDTVSLSAATVTSVFA
jgi:hypothetical protein